MHTFSERILLICAYCEGVIHTKSHLPWLARTYCVYMAEVLKQRVERREYLPNFCHSCYALRCINLLYMRFCCQVGILVLETHQLGVNHTFAIGPNELSALTESNYTIKCRVLPASEHACTIYDHVTVGNSSDIVLSYSSYIDQKGQ